MPHAHHASGLGIGVAAAAAALLYAYVIGLRRPSGSSQALPAWRLGAFLTGVAVVCAALGPSLASCDTSSLTGHMVQHLLLMTIAPPLVLLGDPLRVLSSRMAPRPRRAAARFFRRAGSLQGVVACWLAASATLVLWHVPAVFELALRSPVWHAIEQASFLVTGLLFWLPVIEPWPVRPSSPWSVVLYLFMATLPCDVLSGFLVFSDRIAYSVYLSGASDAVVLADQQRAGALMWTCVTIVYFVAGTLVSSRLLTFGDSPDRSMDDLSIREDAPRSAVRAARVA